MVCAIAWENYVLLWRMWSLKDNIGPDLHVHIESTPIWPEVKVCALLSPLSIVVSFLEYYTWITRHSIIATTRTLPSVFHHCCQQTRLGFVCYMWNYMCYMYVYCRHKDLFSTIHHTPHLSAIVYGALALTPDFNPFQPNEMLQHRQTSMDKVSIARANIENLY